MGDELKWLLKEGGGHIWRTLSLKNRPIAFKSRSTNIQICNVMSKIAAKQYSKNSNLYK